MTVESALFDTLKTLVSNRVYPDFAPEGTTAPYIVYQAVGGRSVQFLERAVVSKKNGRFQVAVWATTRVEAASLNLQIESAIVTSTAFQVELLGAPIAVFDEDTNLRGSLQDFGIWTDR